MKRAGIKFHSISTGKLRRYFDLRTLLMPFKVLLGVWQAWRLLGRLKPNVIFSKGGFVAVPVVWAAWLRRIRIVIHESDAIPGLATKLSAPFANKILLGFETAALEKHHYKMEVVGNPVRPTVLKGKRKEGLKLTGFDGKKPVLLVMGGSSGAQQLNEIVHNEEAELLETFDLIHITGKGKGKACQENSCYRIPYAHEELIHLYALTDVAISRAGAGSLAELEALGIPGLLYPLGLDASRGDQLANAKGLCARSELYRVADPKQSAHSQLLVMPERTTSKSKSDAVKKITTALG